jgi:hypothetical protein
LDGLALILILAVSAFFRLHKLSEQPASLWIDEVSIASNAIALAGQPRLDPFGAMPLMGPNWVKTANLYLYGCWALIWASGFRVLGVKLISVLPGILAAPCLYLFGRRFLPRVASLAAAGGLAVSLWHVTLSRWGWDEVLVTTLVILGFGKLRDGVERGRASDYAASGVVFGLSLYGYIAARLGVVAAVSFLLLRLASSRDASRLKGLLCFLLGLMVTALPLVVSWIHDPRTFMVRVNELSIVEMVLSGNVGLLIGNVKAHLLMFHWSGDQNPRHNLPGLPMLDPVAGMLFLVGILVALRRWRHSEAGIALLWLSVGLLGGVLSAPREAPQAYRTGLVAPACYLLAGLGLYKLLSTVRWKGWRPGPALQLTLVLGWLVVSAAQTYRHYFHDRPRSYECWAFETLGVPATFVRRQMERVRQAGGSVTLDHSLDVKPMILEVDLLTRRSRDSVPVRWADAGALARPDLQKTVLFMTPERWNSVPPSLRDLPARELRSPFGQVVVVGVSADARLLDVLSNDGS